MAPYFTLRPLTESRGSRACLSPMAETAWLSASSSGMHRRLAQIRLDHLGVRAHRGRVSRGDGLAVIEHGDVLADTHHQLHVVLDDQDAERELVAQLADQH